MGDVNYYDQLNRLHFHYPHYESPFRVSINPNFSRWMERYCSQWALNNSGPMRENSHYVALIHNSDLGLFSAVTFPTANWHRLEKLMKWSMMFFIADDYHDLVTQQSKEKSEEMAVDPFWQYIIDMLNGLEHKEMIDRPEWPEFVRGIQTILSELYFDFTNEQIQRSVRMIKDYIQGNLLETEWFDTNNSNEDSENSTVQSNDQVVKNEKNEIPDWNTYMKARLGSVGGQMSLQLIEYAKEVALTEYEFYHPLMKQLERAVSEEMTLVNDYFTFRKEVAENEYCFSKMRHAFPVLVKQGLTLQEAVNSVHQMINDKDKEIFWLMNAIIEDPKLNTTQEASVRLRCFLEGVDEFLGGYWRHAVTARRYHGLNFKGAIPPEGDFHYELQQTVINPTINVHHQYRWLREIPDNVQPNCVSSKS